MEMETIIFVGAFFLATTQKCNGCGHSTTFFITIIPGIVAVVNLHFLPQIERCWRR
jgi:hypothetical protein